jgi:hypothetical protein
MISDDVFIASSAAWEEREKAAQHFVIVRKRWQTRGYADRHYEAAFERLIAAHMAYKASWQSINTKHPNLCINPAMPPFQTPRLVSSGSGEDETSPTYPTSN